MARRWTPSEDVACGSPRRLTGSTADAGAASFRAGVITFSMRKEQTTRNDQLNETVH